MLKRENFELAFFTLSDPLWIGGLGTEVKKNYIARSKLKLGGG